MAYRVPGIGQFVSREVWEQHQAEEADRQAQDVAAAVAAADYDRQAQELQKRLDQGEEASIPAGYEALVEGSAEDDEGIDAEDSTIGAEPSEEDDDDQDDTGSGYDGYDAPDRGEGSHQDDGGSSSDFAEDGYEIEGETEGGTDEGDEEGGEDDDFDRYEIEAERQAAEDLNASRESELEEILDDWDLMNGLDVEEYDYGDSGEGEYGD